MNPNAAMPSGFLSPAHGWCSGLGRVVSMRLTGASSGAPVFFTDLMATIELTGKHAIGPHRFAIVDDADLPYLSEWRWKAKPNGGGNNVYAVRNTVINGRHVTIRMHREVLGLSASDPCDVDHKNHFGLDNRRKNLRVATRSENIANARNRVATAICRVCNERFDRKISAVAPTPVYCSPACERTASRPAYSVVFFAKCEQCQRNFVAKFSSRRFCSDACRCGARRARITGPVTKGHIAGETTAKSR